MLEAMLLVPEVQGSGDAVQFASRVQKALRAVQGSRAAVLSPASYESGITERQVSRGASPNLSKLMIHHFHYLIGREADLDDCA